MTWQTVKLGDVCASVATWNPPRDAPNEKFRYIDIASVDRDDKKVTVAVEYVGKDAPSRARQRVRAGDILVSTVRPNLNAVAPVPAHLDNATASTGFTVLRPIADKLDGAYLRYWVRTPAFVDDMTRKATGQSYPAVSDTIVKGSEIPLPPLAEQKRIAGILDKADALHSLRRDARKRLDALTQSLFLQMFGDPVANPMGWEVATLGDLCTFQNGVGKGKEHYGTGTKVANISDLYLSHTFRPEHYSLIEVSGKEIENYKLERGDLLFVRSSVKASGVAYCSVSIGSKIEYTLFYDPLDSPDFKRGTTCCT